MASNQVDARNKAQTAYKNAVQAGAPQKTIDLLKADLDVKQAAVESTTGGSGDGGILS